MLLGITGTDGAGKGSVVEYLVAQYNFTHYSSRSIIMEHIPVGVEATRNQTRLTANALRAEFGNDVIVLKSLEKMRADDTLCAVIESIRTLAEANTLKNAGGILLAVDADPRLRYERVQGRRSDTDKVSFEQFIAHEELEKNDPDPNGMQKAKVIELADHTITNNGTLEELQASVEAFLASVNYGN